MKKVAAALLLIIASCKEGAQKQIHKPDIQINQVSRGSMKIVEEIDIKQGGLGSVYTIVTKITDGTDTFYAASNLNGGVYLMKK